MLFKGFKCSLVVSENFVTPMQTKFHTSLDGFFIILFSVTWIKLLKSWSKNSHEKMLHNLIDWIAVKNYTFQGLGYYVLL